MTYKDESCEGLDCAWCVTFCCPKEYEYLKAYVKELTEKLEIAKEALLFISVRVRYDRACDSPIPTREACKAYSALKEIGEL